VPKAFVARHELEKTLGVPHKGAHGSDTELTPFEMTEAMKTLNPHYTKDQLKLMARNQPGKFTTNHALLAVVKGYSERLAAFPGGTNLKTGTSGVAPLADVVQPRSPRHPSVKSDAGDESEEEVRHVARFSCVLCVVS